ncbi:MAG: hypothetical protein KJ571_19420 [Bacteroidetes bacterium]|nr:hypothetical protein [Bacteroidota bacterium]
MIVASIDIGTNTVLLLIAETENNTGKLKTINNFYNMPRIGKGVTYGKNISQDKIDLLLKILKEYKKTAEFYKAGIIILTATNALRIAANGKDIALKIKKELDLDINIIDGDTEAKFSYLGAAFSGKSKSLNLVIDIGGGSTEIIFGRYDNIIYKKSFQIGVVTLTEKFITENPPSVKNISEMKLFIEGTFYELKKYSHEKINAVAVAGTPTTLSCIKQNLKEYNDDKVEGSILTKNDLVKLSGEISAQTNDNIKKNYGSVVEGREDVLLSGTLILKILADIINLDEITVSSKGLRYGAVIDYLSTRIQK